MMKKITLLLILLTVSFGYSQTDVLENFDGTAPTITWADDNGGATVAISTTQASSGANSVELITAAAGQPWQGAQLVMQDNKIDMRDATTGVGTNKVVTFNLYSTSPKRFLVKLSTPDLGSTTADESKTAVSHGGTGWELMTADFTVGADLGQPGYNPPNDQFGSIVFFPLFNLDTNVDGWCAGCGMNSALVTTTYVDDVTSWAGDAIGPPAETCSDGIMNQDEEGVDCGGVCSACPTPPTGPPTTPPARAAADVVSIYGNAYTQTPTDGYQTFGSAVVTEIDYSGNTILSTTTPDNGSGFQYQYFGTTPPNIDLSGMTNMHIDFYFEGSPSAVGTVFIVIAQYSDGTNIQKNFDPTSLASSTWHEMDVAFTAFDGNPGYARDDIQQVIVQVAGDEGSLVGPFYVDNLYFHNNMVLSAEDFNKASFKVFPNPTQDSWTVNAQNAEIETIKLYDILGKNVLSLSPNESETVIDGSSLKSGLYFAQIKTATGISSMKLIKN